MNCEKRKSPKDVTKTFLLHSEPRPTVDGSKVLIQNGDQALRVFSLLPAKAAPRVVVEGGPVGQHRIEVDARGADLSYFLHVLQARGAKEPDVGAWLYEGDKDLTVTVNHPTKGIAKVTFEKGEVSKGGRLGYAKAGEPPLTPLGEGVQEMRLGDRGPVWQ